MNKVDKVMNLVEKAQGRIFSVEFIKKDGTIRKMTCRREVHKYSKGGKAGYEVNPLNVGVYEFCQRQGKEAYRNFNADRVLKMKVDGVEYTF